MKPLLLVLLLLSIPLRSQNWIQTSPAQRPGVRIWSALCSEPSRGTSLLFGGFDETTSPTLPQSLGDTWSYDAATDTWTRATPAAAPTPRDSHAMAHDAARGVTVLFGGWDINNVELGDTWEWNGTTWTRVFPPSSPPVRHGGAMVYDSSRGTCVLWGGSDFVQNVDYQDTWEWNGSSWAQIPTQNSPPARSGHAMAHDSARNRTVMFGGWDAQGTPLGDTWEFDGTNWYAATAGPAPAARVWPGMAFDGARSVTVLFGGTSLTADFDDCWEWDGSWVRRLTASRPTPRDSHAMTYDPGANRVILFGGYDLTNDLDDTWEYGPASTPTYVTFGTGCAGSAGVPALDPRTVPALGGTFRLDVLHLPPAGGAIYMVLGLNRRVWNGLPLPLDLSPLGMPGCLAYTNVRGGGLVLHANGTATWMLALPAAPSLSGLHIFNQAVSLDPLAGNPLGAAVSDAGDGLLR
ncbi:MAG: hypothetical protein Fur0037_15290 [Planctomycetota bacterium]